MNFNPFKKTKTEKAMNVLKSIGSGAMKVTVAAGEVALAGAVCVATAAESERRNRTVVTRVVEVPVIQTRTIYVDSKASRIMFLRNEIRRAEETLNRKRRMVHLYTMWDVKAEDLKVQALKRELRLVEQF
jgi:hypothetical protein